LIELIISTSINEISAVRPTRRNRSRIIRRRKRVDGRRHSSTVVWETVFTVHNSKPIREPLDRIDTRARVDGQVNLINTPSTLTNATSNLKTKTDRVKRNSNDAQGAKRPSYRTRPKDLNSLNAISTTPTTLNTNPITSDTLTTQRRTTETRRLRTPLVSYTARGSNARRS
jgi:hypothetical protein